MAKRKQYFPIVASAGVLLLSFAFSAHGATSDSSDSADGVPFPLTIVSQIENASSTNSLMTDAELTFPDGDFLEPPDLQRLAKRVTWFALFIVVVCLLIIGFANRRYRKTRSQNGELHVVETISLGPRCFCDLLNVRGQLFVVARDASGLKSMRQVNSFGETFAATAESPQVPEHTLEYEFAGNTLVSEGV